MWITLLIVTVIIAVVAAVNYSLEYISGPFIITFIVGFILCLIVGIPCWAALLVADGVAVGVLAYELGAFDGAGKASSQTYSVTSTEDDEIDDAMDEQDIVEEREQGVQSLTNEELLKAFDEAVKAKDESEAIIFGGDLLDQGETIHVMLGFKEVADSGSEQCLVLYLHLAYRMACSGRNSESAWPFMWRMQINELEEAIQRAKTSGSDEIGEILEKLQLELISWHVVAAKSTDETDAVKHMSIAKEMFETTPCNHQGDWLPNYFRFWEEHGLIE